MTLATLPPELLTLAQRLACLTEEQRADAVGKLPAERQRELVAAITSVPQIGARIGAKAALTKRQHEARDLLNGPATHVALWGGARSGKTFVACHAIAERALAHPSRHAILRFRFSHLHASIIEDTWPKVLALCFPGAKGKLDRQLWVYRFDHGSEVWFGGLDEKERTDKVLGQEHATIFFNEASQIPLASRSTAITRLAQNTPLKLLAIYDANPPSRRHWLHFYFIDKIDPNRHQPLANPEAYAELRMNPVHNVANLKPEYLAELEQLDERRRRRFYLGEWSDEDDTALWSPAMLDRGRLVSGSPPAMQRVVVAVDPSGCSGPEDLRSDEVGIVVVGLGADGKGYVLEDLSGRFGPAGWKKVAVSAYDRWGADCVVAETNYGGAMVGEVIRTAVGEGGYPVAFRAVTASRGKVVRAEPIAALWSQDRVCLAGRFRELENQMLAMTTGGYRGDKSPDRLDAMVWGLTALFPAMAREARDAASGGVETRRRGRVPRVILSPGAQQQLGHYRDRAQRRPARR